jgi:hypothetical protein
LRLASATQGQGDYGPGDQIIDQQHGGTAQRAQRIQGEQLGVAGAGADQGTPELAR